MPDAAGLEAAERALELADSAGPDDLVLVLLSGGASANWIAPADGLSLADKQAVTRALLRSGANIGEINTVRKHLSRIKGGRLARRAHPARVVTLAISDVPGDDPAVIGSGPTVPDPTTLADARAHRRALQLDLPGRGHAGARRPGQRIAEARRSDLRSHRVQARSRARPTPSARPSRRCGPPATSASCSATASKAKPATSPPTTPAGALALQQQGRRAVILSGGELTVTIRGQGRGGPNQEYALALAIALQGAPGIAALAGDTDGTDGGGGAAADPAGAVVDRDHARAGPPAWPRSGPFSRRQRFHRVFQPLGDLVETGPTWTNVNDFRAIVVDRP